MTRRPYLRCLPCLSRVAVGIAASAVSIICASNPEPAHAQTQQPFLAADLACAKTSFYFNEPFEITLSVRSSGLSLGQGFELVGLPAPEVLKLEEFRPLPGERTAVDGRMTEVRSFRTRAVPGVTGTLTLSPVLKVGVVGREWTFFGPREVQYQRDLAVSPLNLTILPVPQEGRPASYSGAVGTFTLDVDVQPRDLAMGDLVTVRTRIHGKGHLDPIRPPSLNVEACFRAYDAKLVSARPGEERVYEQVVIPQTTNACLLPGLEFAYFDPAAARYVTLASSPVPLTFHGETVAVFEPFKPQTNAADERPGPSFFARTPGTNPELWRRLADVGFWISGISTAAWAMTRRRRRLAGALVVLLAWTAMAVPFHSAVRRIGSKEGLVRLEVQSDARLAPGTASEVIFSIPDGSAVRILEQSQSWARVASGSRRGWIMLSDIEQPAALP